MKKKKKPQESIFAIDLLSLDEAWQAQPELKKKYGVKLADAKLAHEEEVTELSVVKAELDQSIRKRPGKYGIDKISEKAIEHTILLHSKYRDQQKKVSTAKHLVDVLTAYNNALDHKKSALGKLVDLHGQQYFSTPTSRGEGREYMEEVTKKKVRKGVKRKKRGEIDEDDLDDDEE